MTMIEAANGERGHVAPWAKALGWFSIGLGVAQLVAPRRVSHLLGVNADAPYTQLALAAVGVWEIACGIGLLSRARPGAWTWARVAGDALDLALIGGALSSGHTNRNRLLMSAAGVVGIAGLDAKAVSLARSLPQAVEGIRVSQSVTVARSRSEVYAFFRHLENLPTFMSHLESVRTNGGRSHWRARGPLGMPIEWDAEVVQDVPNELIAWRSTNDADVPNSGTVQFRDRLGGLDTELSVELVYEPPAGAVGAAVAKLFGKEPSQQISADLRRLKQVLETGEVLHSDASVHRGMHPARPSRETPTFAKDLRS
jgi:uncharacterized membrane protein